MFSYQRHSLTLVFLFSLARGPSKFQQDQDSEEEQVEKENTRLSKSKGERHCEKLADQISRLWNNSNWTSQVIEDGLQPISLKGPKLLKTLSSLAEITPCQSDGFPPLVLAALRQALDERRRILPIGFERSSLGWPQQPVVETALRMVSQKEVEKDRIKEATSSKDPAPSQDVKGKGKASMDGNLSISSSSAPKPSPSSSNSELDYLLEKCEEMVRLGMNSKVFSARYKEEIIKNHETIKFVAES